MWSATKYMKLKCVSKGFALPHFHNDLLYSRKIRLYCSWVIAFSYIALTWSYSSFSLNLHLFFMDLTGFTNTYFYLSHAQYNIYWTCSEMLESELRISYRRSRTITICQSYHIFYLISEFLLSLTLIQYCTACLLKVIR